jgi:hypothetical protein
LPVLLPTGATLGHGGGGRGVQIWCHFEPLYSSGGVGRRRNSRSPAERACKDGACPLRDTSLRGPSRPSRDEGCGQHTNASSCPHPPMRIVLLSTPSDGLGACREQENRQGTKNANEEWGWRGT